MFGEVGYDKVRGESNDARQDAFEDEDPAPSMVATDAVHLADLNHFGVNTSLLGYFRGYKMCLMKRERCNSPGYDERRVDEPD